MPDFVTIESAPPADPPISESKRFVMTRNSLIASCENFARARPSVGSVKSTPSTRMVDWLALPPPPMTGEFVMKRNPPRSRCTPGARNARFWKSRLPTGSSWICSGTMLVEESVLKTSIIGVSPVTLTVSARPPTFIVADSLSVCPTRSARPSWTTLWKPESSTFTL